MRFCFFWVTVILGICLNGLHQLHFNCCVSNAGTYMIPSARTYPGLCFCKDLQTTAYEVVKGSYVPTSQIKQESKPEVLLLSFDIYFVSGTHLTETQTYYKNKWKSKKMISKKNDAKVLHCVITTFGVSWKYYNKRIN